MGWFWDNEWEFPCGEKKNSSERLNILMGLAWTSKEWNYRFMLLLYCNQMGLRDLWNFATLEHQCHVFMFTCQIPRALKYGHLNSSWFGFQWELIKSLALQKTQPLLPRQPNFSPTASISVWTFCLSFMVPFGIWYFWHICCVRNRQVPPGAWENR